MNDYFKWITTDDDVEYKTKLQQHIDSGSPSWGPLLAPQNALRAYQAAVALVKDNEAVLQDLAVERADIQQACFRKGPWGKQEWFDYEAEYMARRSKVVRAQRAYQAAVSKLKPAKRAANVEVGLQEHERYVALDAAAGASDGAQVREVLEAVIRSIAQHKQSTEWNQIDPSVADRALWSQLSRIKMPGRGENISLREWMARSDAMRESAGA